MCIRDSPLPAADRRRRGAANPAATDRGSRPALHTAASRREHEAMKACGFEVLDATCPFVLKIHRLVEKYSKEGYRIVIGINTMVRFQGFLMKLIMK